MPKLLKFCLLLFIAVFVVGCGGGGGEASSKTSTTATTATYSLVLAVVDANNNVVNGITYGGGQKIRATYTDAYGNPVKQTLVSFSVSTNVSAAALAYAYVTTNDSGIAYDPISPATATTSGAATVSATAGKATSTVDFSISGSTVTIGSPSLGSTTLAASGTTSVDVLASANGTLASGILVAFTADCGTLTPPTNQSNGSGKATSSYSAVKADGSSCSGDIKIYAAASGNTTNSTLNVASPTASAVNFVSATPSQISVAGSGAATQSSLSFRVLDGTGRPYANATVTAAITTNPGGVGLGAVNSTSTLSRQSDGNGYVNFSIYSGTLPGPVQVKVSLSDTAYAYSNNITVQSGPPAQERFSLSVGTFNIEGQNIDRITTTLTISAADRQGNAVPDGTVINFTSSGGQVQPSCATSRTNGISGCSVTFSSQSYRPPNGRIPVLAFAEGIKTFSDINYNNTFESTSDYLTNMGDAYRDDNENGVYDPGEFLLQRGGDSACPTSVWGTPSRADTCDSSTAATTVRSQTVLLMATSSGVLTNTSESSSALTFRANSTTKCNDDTLCLPLAAGTTFTATTTDPTACTAGSVSGSPLPSIAPTSNLNEQLGTLHEVLLTPATGKTCKGTTVKVTGKSPSGLATTYSLTVP